MTESAGTESAVNLVVCDANCQNESVTECLVQCKTAGGQTQTHRSVGTADTQHIPTLSFTAEHIPFSHVGTRILNQLREELLSQAECYLHQALSGTRATCSFREAVPRPSPPLRTEASFTSLMHRRAYRREAGW